MLHAKAIVVSAADDQYFSLIRDLVVSVRALSFKVDFDIGVLDVGFGSANRAALEAQGVIVTGTRSDIDYPMREAWEKAKPGIRAQTARPFLRDYVPGYGAYMWLDADVWVQTPEAVDTMLTAAMHGPELCIAPEFDRCYNRFFQHAGVWQVNRDWYQANFGTDVANAMTLKPTLNTGVIAMSKDSPVWDVWRKICEKAFRAQQAEFSGAGFMLEQQSMNLAVYLENAPCFRMPAIYNWLTFYAVPMLDQATVLYVEPMPPYRPISHIHLTQRIKEQVEKIECVGGGFVERPLTFSAREP